MSSPAVRDVEPPEMTLGAFRRFQLEQPDEERWELIEGVPHMMTPPYIAHQRIATNLQSFLNDAIAATGLGRFALQRTGVALGIDGQILREIGRAARYAPEPDVAVIDDSPDPERRFAERVYVLAEVVSSTDDERVLKSGLRWIEAKTRLYRAHPHCEAVVVVERSRVEVRVSLRVADGWRDVVLTEADQRLELPTCGLVCKVGDLYRGTHLDPSLTRPA